MAATDERARKTGPAAESRSWRGSLRGFRDFNQAIARTGDLDELFATLRIEIASLITARLMFLALYDEASRTVEVVRQTDFEVEVPGGTFPLGGGVTSEVIRTRHSRLIRRWSQEASPVELQYLSSTPGLPESALTVPLLFGDQVLGVIAVQDYQPNAFDEDDLLALEVIANQVATTIANLRHSNRLDTQLQRRVSESEAILANISDALLVLDAAGRLVRLNRAARELLCVDATSLVLGQSLDREQWGQWPLGAQQVAETLAPMIELLRQGQKPPSIEVEVRAQGRRLLSFSGTPLTDANGALTGCLLVVRDITMRHEMERLKDERLLIASDNLTRAEADLRHQIFHDRLTGLPNRTLLNGRLERALRDADGNEARCALLLLDLDRFKVVNDSLGHHVGDILLQQIGQRLQSAVLPADLVARLGGDEFAVLLVRTDAVRAAQVANQLVRVLQRPFQLENQSIDVDASIGIVVAPLHGQDADTLMRRADIAMYQAKGSGMGIAVYSRAEDQQQPNRLALLGDLRHAIESNQLLLHYQPKLDLHQGTLVGVEALVRWQHPLRGLLPPEEFIPLTEQSGLIHPLSRWVLDTVLRQQQLWRAGGLNLPVAVNLSRRILHDPQLPDAVAQLLTRWDVPGSALVLEITESTLMADPLRARENLSNLRAMGVSVSIDDFGTGYSSLASLQDLPVDELKIDQSFVKSMASNPSSRAIVRAIIDLADALNLRVVAEGVEDRATWDLLAGLGCDVAQGYFLSPAIAAAELEAWVADVRPTWLALADSPHVNETLQERIRVRGSRLAAEEEFVGRKHAEAALQISEARNRLALQAARMGTWDWDVIRDVRTWSAETEALHGLAPGTFDQTSPGFRSLVHPEDWPAIESEMQESKVQGREMFAVYRPVWPDRSVHWIEARGRGRYGADGALQHMSGTSMDITQRKRAEEALRALEHEARAEAENAAVRGSVFTEISRVLVENLMDHRPMLGRVAQIAAAATNTACVIQLVAEGGVDVDLVPLAVDHTDHSVRSELIRVFSVPRTTADRPWEELDQSFLELHPLMDFMSVPMLTPTALIGVLSLGRFGSDAVRFTDADRRFSNDLAARVALAVENASLYEKARTAIELRDKFLTIAAHELKTPLTTMQGYSQLLTLQLPADAAPARRSAQVIEERTKHLARLVEQILDVSRLGAAGMQLNCADTELVGMIRDLLAGFDTPPDAAPEFRLHFEQEHVQAVVDRVRLAQVMTNLIENAVRNSPQGSPIDISVGQGQDDAVTLGVRDYGSGIPEEHRAQIFDRFHQAQALDYRSGMGLGLHISREIVALHGGKIRVDFPADGGSHFTVWLPRTVHTPDGGVVDKLGDVLSRHLQGME
jgi:diguanylate cyclase (GGDEF)-like protein/PAS domain S-box-containing protein